MLKLGNAVALIIKDNANKLLLQHRDNIENIWYPDHWGLFGGELKKREKPISGLNREIKEEISINLENKITFLFEFGFDLQLIGKSKYYRQYYLATITEQEKKKIKLNEGQGYCFYKYEEIVQNKILIIPCDKFAIDIYMKNKDGEI
jgi:8-oxo-dGTP pyrophosphatase MutT (NUDIX family)